MWACPTQREVHLDQVRRSWTLQNRFLFFVVLSIQREELERRKKKVSVNVLGEPTKALAIALPLEHAAHEHFHGTSIKILQWHISLQMKGENVVSLGTPQTVKQWKSYAHTNVMASPLMLPFTIPVIFLESCHVGLTVMSLTWFSTLGVPIHSQIL